MTMRPTAPRTNRKSLTDRLTNRPDEKRKVFRNEPDKAVIPARPQPGALHA